MDKKAFRSLQPSLKAPYPKISIGVLALQGGFAEHMSHLNQLNTNTVAVRTLKDLDQVSKLIIPGGESTTITRFLEKEGWYVPLCQKVKSGKLAIWGTCAGAILLAKSIVPNKKYSNPIKPLQLIDITVERNAYGRQVDSFTAVLDPKPNQSLVNALSDSVPMVFIRAPKLTQIGKTVHVLATLNEQPVAVQQSGVLATSFHPELTDSLKWHQYFLNTV